MLLLKYYGVYYFSVEFECKFIKNSFCKARSSSYSFSCLWCSFPREEMSFLFVGLHGLRRKVNGVNFKRRSDFFAAWASQKCQWTVSVMKRQMMRVFGILSELWAVLLLFCCFESWWDGEGFLKKCSTSWSNFSLATPFAPKGKSVGIGKVSVFWKLFLSENITQYLWVCRATQQTLAVDRSFRQRWFPEKRFSKEDDNCFAINGKEWEKWTSDQSV